MEFSQDFLLKLLILETEYANIDRPVLGVSRDREAFDQHLTKVGQQLAEFAGYGNENRILYLENPLTKAVLPIALTAYQRHSFTGGDNHLHIQACMYLTSATDKFSMMQFVGAPYHCRLIDGIGTDRVFITDVLVQVQTIGMGGRFHYIMEMIAIPKVAMNIHEFIGDKFGRDVVRYFDTAMKKIDDCGPLHIFISDGNCSDEDIQFCLKEALGENGVENDVRAASMLMLLTEEERGHVYQYYSKMVKSA